MVGCTSALTCQGSTEPRLRSASGLRAWDVARVCRTATFVCLSACRTRLLLTSAICGAFWRLRRRGIMRSWRRWRWSSRNRLDPQSLPRLRAPVAHEGRPVHCALSATPTTPLQWYQVTSFEFISVRSALRAASFPGRVGLSLQHVSLLLMSLIYLAGGAPRAASSPSRSGLTQWHVSCMRLSKLICLSCLTSL